jgi:serine/threonine-protein kinase
MIAGAPAAAMPGSNAAIAMHPTLIAAAAPAPAPPRRPPLPPFVPGAPPRIDQTTVAVLPVTCAPGDEYLADGLLDDLIDTLSSTGTLRVRPAGAVRARTEPDPRALGAALDVDHVVACALRRMPLGLRVTARLIGVADGFQIWARREDCTEAEILLVAERLGRGIATALSARATGGDRPTDPRAVELYLRARAELRRFWADHTENAVDLLEQAAACADSPPILGALAYACVQAWIMRGDPALAQRAEEAIERGLPSGHGEAFLAASSYKLNQGDLEGAVTALRHALVRAPMSAPAHETAGKILIEVNARAEGRFHLETALALDPGRASVIGVDLSRLDALEGNWASATASCRRLLDDLDPSVVQLGAIVTARLAGWRNDRPAMVEAVSRFAARVESDAHLLAFFKQSMITGQLDLAQWNQLDQRFTRRDRPQRMQILGLQLMTELAILLGHDDLAIRALAKAADLGLIDITWLDGCPLFAPLTVDLRWCAIRDAVALRADRVLAAFRAAAG